MDSEFVLLAAELDKSGCAKKQIAAGTYVDGVWTVAVNSCDYKGDQCPRLNLPSGVGYELCQARHAEATLAAQIKDAGRASDGIAWVFAHYWACEPCASALKAAGVKEIRVRESVAK
jgi:deoxycytidylate deaminase